MPKQLSTLKHRLELFAVDIKQPHNNNYSKTLNICGIKISRFNENGIFAEIVLAIMNTMSQENKLLRLTTAILVGCTMYMYNLMDLYRKKSHSSDTPFIQTSHNYAYVNILKIKYWRTYIFAIYINHQYRQNLVTARYICFIVPLRKRFALTAATSFLAHQIHVMISACFTCTYKSYLNHVISHRTG